MKEVKHFFVDNGGYRGVIYSTPKSNKLGEGQYFDVFGGLSDTFSFTKTYLKELELFSTDYAMNEKYHKVQNTGEKQMQRLVIEKKAGTVNVNAGEVEDPEIYIELLAEAVAKLERISLLSREEIIERMEKDKK